MQNTIIFSFPDNQALADSIAGKLRIDLGIAEIRDFPDGETYIRINSDVRDKNVILVCTLDHPNTKFLPLAFFVKTLKEFNAKKICLIAPYLPYMRQDIRFNPGEAITSGIFASELSQLVNCLITIDPHLHRIHSLSTIYTIPEIFTLHATKEIAKWIGNNIKQPFIIGPDEESEQWVADVAKDISAPFAIIKKIRHGDRSVSIDIPEMTDIHRTPVLVDDIISTGVSMQAILHQLILKGFIDPVCIAVHALFDKNTYDNLINAGAKKIITCNSIPHYTNQIDITNLIVEALSCSP